MHLVDVSIDDENEDITIDNNLLDEIEKYIKNGLNLNNSPVYFVITGVPCTENFHNANTIILANTEELKEKLKPVEETLKPILKNSIIIHIFLDENLANKSIFQNSEWENLLNNIAPNGYTNDSYSIEEILSKQNEALSSSC